MMLVDSLVHECGLSEVAGPGSELASMPTEVNGRVINDGGMIESCCSWGGVDGEEEEEEDAE
jgi:hypothetical protein